MTIAKGNPKDIPELSVFLHYIADYFGYEIEMLEVRPKGYLNERQKTT